MATQSWSLIVSAAPIRAKPAGLWTHVHDYIQKGTLLKIEVIAPPPVHTKRPKEVEPPTDASHPAQEAREQPPATPVTWRYSRIGMCGPDGDYTSSIDIASLITDKAPVGALIGKIGGSTSGKNDGVLVFCVGSFCVLRLSDAQEGAMFLTINDSPKGFRDNDGQIVVNVYEGL